MPLERKKTLNVFREAKNAWGSYDEYPVGPPGTDPMPHLSRNRVPQPFFVVCEHDQVLIQMSGAGVLEMRETVVEQMTLSAGDTIYIPAGVPTRVVPEGENVQVRLRAEPRGREAVAWYCTPCGELVHTRELEQGLLQRGYLEALRAFNADVSSRTCPRCGVLHPEAELGDIAWEAVAEALAQEDG